MLICMQKNKLHPSLLCWNIAKILQTCYFGCFGYVWLRPVKRTLPACRKLWCLYSCKKWYLSLTSFLEYFNDIANLLFWVLWACPSKPIIQTCRKLWCLPAYKKSTWSLIFFYRYHILKNSAIWLPKNILGNNSRTRILSDIRFLMESQESKEFSFCIVFRKNQWQNFQKNVKYSILGLFLAKFGQKWIFNKNQAPSLFSIYSPLTSCKNSEKTN